MRPITVGRSSLRRGSHRYLMLPRLERGSRRFFPGPPRLLVPVLVLPLLPPTTGTSTGETQKALAEAPITSATGPETPAAAPESPATTPTSGETMLPGESHEWLDNDGEGLFTEPPKKGKK